MGYTKIVQYGDTIEVYSYEKNIKKEGIDRLKAERLFNPQRTDDLQRNNSVIEKRKKQLRLQSQAKGLYRRSDASIKRSRLNFFRMVHHNNCKAQSIHFLTLTFAYDTTYKEASRSVAKFFERLRKHFGEVPLSYISVPELTEKGRLHFHLLLYNLPADFEKIERKTRNFQRLFHRGYLDLRFASYNSKGIAGYMAKYMAKALGHSKNEARRGYNCSRNIERFLVSGGNTMSYYADLIIPTEDVEIEVESSYDIPYLGTCQYKKIKKINYANI